MWLFALPNCNTNRMASGEHNSNNDFFQDKFLPFVDMFQKETIKVDVCKIIMEAFVK